VADLAECWRAANQKLRHLADCICSGVAQPPHVALGYVTALAEELRHTETLLRESQADAAVRGQCNEPLLEYRNCLKRLQEALPAFQAQLLAERSRLEPERAHVQAAAAWAQTTKHTME
jgi:hypothetical protein